MSDLERFQCPRFARRYVAVSDRIDRMGGAELRADLLRGLRGRVVEVGCGDGKNFAHYPASVEHVLAVEPDDTFRALAREAAARAPVPVTVVAGHADQLPVPDGELDAVVLTLVLCSVPDVASALREAHRALRAGGQLRFAEHVRAGNRVAAALQDLLTPLSRRYDGNCHLGRDTAASIAASPFTVTRLRRFGFPVLPLLPGQPMISGVAVKGSA